MMISNRVKLIILLISVIFVGASFVFAVFISRNEEKTTIDVVDEASVSSGFIGKVGETHTDLDEEFDPELDDKTPEEDPDDIIEDPESE